MSKSLRDLRVVLVAEEAAGVQALRAVAASGATVVAVATSSAARTRGVTVADLARTHGYPLWHGDSVCFPELALELRERHVDLLLNVHSLHRIHSQVVAAPRLGSFNLHPGPLPEFAGLNAPSWAVYLGERRHAVTLHRMTVGIDTGAVCYEAWFDLDDAATGLSVSSRCVRLGIPLIERLLQAAAAGAALPVREQDLRRRRQFRRRDIPYGGIVPWHKTAAELARWVRASDFHPLPSPWGYPQTSLDGRPLYLAGADADGEETAAEPGTVLGVGERGSRVATGGGTLHVRTLITDQERRAAVDVLRPGMMLG
jgi:methionyl-tRNA formyltransferase